MDVYMHTDSHAGNSLCLKSADPCTEWLNLIQFNLIFEYSRAVMSLCKHAVVSENVSELDY